jgi:hypothetical protein
MYASLYGVIFPEKTAIFVFYLNKRVQQARSEVSKLVLVGPVAIREHSIWFRLR